MKISCMCTFNPLTHWGGANQPPTFLKHDYSKKCEVLKICKNKLMHGNYLSFIFAFICLIINRRYLLVIHGSLGLSPRVGARM